MHLRRNHPAKHGMALAGLFTMANKRFSVVTDSGFCAAFNKELKPSETSAAAAAVPSIITAIIIIIIICAEPK